MQERDDRIIGRIASILRRSGEADAKTLIDRYAVRFAWDASRKRTVLKQARQRAAQARQRQQIQQALFRGSTGKGHEASFSILRGET